MPMRCRKVVSSLVGPAVWLALAQLILIATARPVQLRRFGTDIFPEAESAVARVEAPTHQAHLETPAVAAATHNEHTPPVGVPPVATASEAPGLDLLAQVASSTRHGDVHGVEAVMGKGKAAVTSEQPVALAKVEDKAQSSAQPLEVKLLEPKPRKTGAQATALYEARRKLRRGKVPLEQWPEHLLTASDRRKLSPPTSDPDLIANGNRSVYDFSHGVPLDRKAQIAAANRRFKRRHPEKAREYGIRNRQRKKLEQQGLASTSGPSAAAAPADGAQASATASGGEHGAP